MIPSLESSLGEGVGYQLQYSWASLVTHTVKNLPATWETWVRSLDWEDPLEEGMVTHSSILAWRIHMDRGTWKATVHGVTKSSTRRSDFHPLIYILSFYEEIPIAQIIFSIQKIF